MKSNLLIFCFYFFLSSCQKRCEDSSDYNLVSTKTHELSPVDNSWKHFSTNQNVIFENQFGIKDTFQASKDSIFYYPFSTFNEKKCTRTQDNCAAFNWTLTNSPDSNYNSFPFHWSPSELNQFYFLSGSSYEYAKGFFPQIQIKFRKVYNAAANEGAKYPFTEINNYQLNGQIYNQVYVISADTSIIDSNLIYKRVYFQQSLGIIKFDRADGTVWHILN